MKKHYLIYQITNNVNGKIYIGKHETFHVDDDYFGSGKHLKRAIKKYGLENFTKTILIELQNAEEMNLLEKLVVTPEFCAREDVYNINVGGDGGWYVINKQRKEHPELLDYIKQQASLRTKEWNANIDKTEWKKKISDGLKKFYAKHPEKHGTLGKHWKSQKMSERMKDPTRNKMSQSRWIHNIQTLEFKIWPKNKDLPVGWAIGRKPHVENIPKNLNHPNLNYCWISKDADHKYIIKNELEKWLNLGWHKGRK